MSSKERRVGRGRGVEGDGIFKEGQLIGCFGFMALLDSILFYIGSSTRKMEKEKRNDRREKKYLKRKKQASSASTDDSCPTIIQTSCFPFLNFSIICL